MIAPPSWQWERMWAPYDEATYQAVLDEVQPDDVVLDVGAGDLRLALRMAEKAKLVYALELNKAQLPALTSLPPNMRVICADARKVQFPGGITLGVLLMRHCCHYQLYANKLAAVGCRRLATNARWGMGLELVNLRQRAPYSTVPIGWYACHCGSIGFKPGPVESITPAVETFVHEVENCPTCQKG